MPDDAISALIVRFRDAVAAEVRLETATATMKPLCERTAVQARANLEMALRAALPRRAESTSRMQAVTVPITISIAEDGEKNEKEGNK